MLSRSATRIISGSRAPILLARCLRSAYYGRGHAAAIETTRTVHTLLPLLLADTVSTHTILRQQVRTSYQRQGCSPYPTRCDACRMSAFALSRISHLGGDPVICSTLIADIHRCAGVPLLRPQPLQRGVASWNRDKFNLVKLKAAVDNAQQEEEFLRQVPPQIHCAPFLLLIHPWAHYKAAAKRRKRSSSRRLRHG
jgi:hypothetical protein